MDEAISAADANRGEFSRLLREVRQGRSFVVTSQESPSLALLRFRSVERQAKTALLDRLSKGKISTSVHGRETAL